MELSKTINWIVVSRDDVYCLPKLGLNDLVIAFTPDASFAAKEFLLKGQVVVDSSYIYTDSQQVKSVIDVKNTLKAYDEVASTKIPSDIYVLHRQLVWSISCLTSRIARSVPKNGGYLYSDSGEWIFFQNPDDAIKYLLPRFLFFGNLHYRYNTTHVPFPKLFNIAQEIFLKFKLKGRGCVLSSSPKMKFGIDEIFKKIGISRLLVTQSKGGFSEYWSLLQRFVQPDTGKNFVRLVICPKKICHHELEQLTSELNNTISAVNSEAVKFAWSVCRKEFINSLRCYLSIINGASEALKYTNCKFSINYEGNSWSAVVVMKISKSLGILNFVANHNSHPFTQCARANFVLSNLYWSRARNPMVDVSIEEANKSIRNQCDSSPELYGKVLFAKRRVYDLIKPVNLAKNKKFIFLYAGNYQDWQSYFPYISESSDEFYNSIVSLSKQVSSEEESFEIVVRVRNKSELNSSLLNFINESKNIRISDSFKSFWEELSYSDALISNYSTTVDEALEAKKPVVLWGNCKRFLQYHANFEPPSIGTRSAMYGVLNEVSILPMLRSISLEFHNNPLVDSELPKIKYLNEAKSLENIIASYCLDDTSVIE